MSNSCVTKSKRARAFQTTCTASDRALIDAYQLAYWCQWRLAIHGFCTDIDTMGEENSDLHWVREQRDQLNLAKQTALFAEVRHLESQLGKQASTNAKLEVAISEGSEAMIKMEVERDAAALTICRLESQLALHEESATASRRELEERVSSIQSTCEGLRLEAREAQDAQKMATELAASQLQRCQQVQEELNDARQTAKLLAQEKGEELSRPGTLEAKLENVTDKYDTLKRRYVEAGRKVESLRAERDTLRRRCSELEDKLADVEKFQHSERGRALDRMEQELASEKMARVELEADRDDLQTQLAAALRTNRRT